MDELQIYDTGGLFHQIVKASRIMNGRYAVLEKGAHDLNLNNLLSGLDLPEDKYPGVFCLPPVSEIDERGREKFNFRLLFLCNSHSTGDNQFKDRDPLTNTSSHTIAEDWRDMKIVAVNFIQAIYKLIKDEAINQMFIMAESVNERIIRIAGMQNDNLSGVMILFSAYLGKSCEFTDIDMSAIDLTFPEHENHFH